MSPELLIAAEGYVMPQAAKDLLAEHPPLMIAGISSAGKDTIAREIVQKSNWRRVVSHTTRQPRKGERNGNNYWFVSDDEMLRLATKKALIDLKVVHHIKVYGTTIEAYRQVLNTGHQPMMIVDIQGVDEILKCLTSDYKPVFIIPPDYDTWLKRLRKQSTVTSDEITRRLRSSKAEIQSVLRNGHYKLVVNRAVGLAVKEVISEPSDLSSQSTNRKIAQQLLEAL